MSASAVIPTGLAMTAANFLFALFSFNTGVLLFLSRIFVGNIALSLLNADLLRLPLQLLLETWANLIEEIAHNGSRHVTSGNPLVWSPLVKSRVCVARFIRR